jgi:DNA-binding MarR family transcriptional regulator
LAGRKKKMRRRKAMVSWRAKLSPAQVRKLRKLYASGSYTTLVLAERFGVSQTTVSNILNGKVYRGVV